MPHCRPQCRRSPPEAPSLELAEVDATFDRIAHVAAGKGSTGERQRLVRELLARATHEEQSFLFRLVTGELRQGAVEGLMLEAVAKAAGVPAESVRRARMMAGDLPSVAKAALSGDPAELAAFATQLFRPVHPMLAGSAEDPAVAIKELGEAALEYKLDGARIQIHKSGDQVAVYSRRLNEVTAAVPEVVELVRSLPARELILDGEVIALREDGTPHPFQTTMSRSPSSLIATAGSAADPASMGCTGRNSWVAKASCAGSPLNAAFATVGGSPAIIRARRTLSAGTPAALATASSIRPSTAPWRSSPTTSRKRKLCSSWVARASSSRTSRCRSPAEPCPCAIRLNSSIHLSRLEARAPRGDLRHSACNTA